MITKQEILDEIKRTAKSNGDKPLGVRRFEKEMGITTNDWQRYWARFSDAQKEAGFAPNQMTSAYTDEFLIEKTVSLMRRLGKFPTQSDLRFERHNNTEFPDSNVFSRLGSKLQFSRKIVEYCKTRSGYDDIIRFCEPVLEKSSRQKNFSETDINEKVGEVYLFKSGRYYKIGMTIDTVRRGHELRIQLPEKMDLIHSIKTDDPSGVEAYWHKRFDSKRMNGEWFDLNSADIKAFKRWRRIY